MLTVVYIFVANGWQWVQLEIGARLGVSGKIDFIQPEQMTAPLMRGKDCKGKPFFAMRLLKNKSVHLVCNVHEQYGGRWNNLSDVCSALDLMELQNATVLLSNDTPNIQLITVLGQLLVGKTCGAIRPWDGITETLDLV